MQRHGPKASHTALKNSTEEQQVKQLSFSAPTKQLKKKKKLSDSWCSVTQCRREKDDNGFAFVSKISHGLEDRLMKASEKS